MESPRYDWLRRAARSFLQGAVGVFIFLALPVLQNMAGGNVEIDWAFWRMVGIASVAGGVIALVTAIQNLLEDKAGMPAVLKGKPSSGANPVPDPGP